MNLIKYFIEKGEIGETFPEKNFLQTLEAPAHIPISMTQTPMVGFARNRAAHLGAHNTHRFEKDDMMRAYDFSPLYRNFVGFDRMANMIDNAATQAAKSGTGYPPYNVARLSEDSYRIELAVAGFTAEDIEIETHEGVLTVIGDQSPKAENDAAEYLHRGIAERGFERRFQLADHVRVSGADLTNGLLIISLEREVPEALRPQKIAINSATKQAKALQSDGKLIAGKSSKSKKAA